MKHPKIVRAFQGCKCPKCGEFDRLRLTVITQMVNCPVCKWVFKLKI